MKKYFNKHIAITNEHGSWVFFLSPLLIGIIIGGSLSTVTLYLVISSLAGFMMRHPITIAIKVVTGRRNQRDMAPAIFWILVYASIGLIMIIGLVARGFGYILVLSIPGIIVFIWYLILVKNRAERGKIGVEIVASGVLALSAPAAYWIALGKPDMVGWILWILTWLQSAASIVYAYLRLTQRRLTAIPKIKTRFDLGKRAILYSSFNIFFALILAVFDLTPMWIFLSFFVQWLECIQGTIRPAIGVTPIKIGIRQLTISTIFTLLFIGIWISG